MKVFSFVKKVFVIGLTVLSSSITDALNCVSMNTQKCKVRPKLLILIVIIQCFILLVLQINRCSGNCNNINDP